MGILYAWATKEYLLERMSFGQIVMYLNEGLRFKYPKPKTGGTSGSTGSLVGASAEEIVARRDALRKKYIEG